MSYILRRLMNRRQLQKIFVERMTEPLHLNLLSLPVALVGSYRTKVAFDLIVRQQYAFPILYAADVAVRYGIKHVTLIEFGVATGAGLMNMCRIAARTQTVTGVEFSIYGFDTGRGMPPARDYRDLPEHFQQGDFIMNRDALERALPPSAKLVLGDIETTLPSFLASVPADRPIGFVSIDVDYYSSASQALNVLRGAPEQYLPIVPVYLDDIGVDGSNPWTGELLAVSEFNDSSDARKICPMSMLRSKRIFKNPQWIDRMFAAHIHDHPRRSPSARRAEARVIQNEYLD